MTGEDPLNLIAEAGVRTDPSGRVGRQSELARYLQVFEAALALDDPKASEKMLSDTGTHLCRSAIPASRELASRLSEVYGTIVASGAKGRQPAERGILTSLVTGADESMVGFFSGLFDVVIERDRFSPQRRAFAAAGLGVLVRVKGSRTALTALLQAAAHANGDAAVAAVRALLAVYGSGHSCTLGSRRTVGSSMRLAPPPEVIACLLECASHQGSFLARFHARRALLFLGAVAPLDHPEGAYQFKMTVEGHPGFSAHLLLPSSSDLESVFWLSLNALRWDNDHLHSFYLSGKCHDPLTEYPADHEQGRDPGMAVGQLGLAAGVRFVCLYDFGDSNVFKYTCEKIIPAPVGLQQGVIIKRSGRTPRQYHSW